METKLGLAAALTLATALPALAEVNIYSYRQPELIQPLVDAFTAETGIEVNIAFLNQGLTERLLAEGTRTPADVILTADVQHLAEAVEAGVTQPVESDVLTANVPEGFRDPDNQWFGLTSRARIVYASRDRVRPGEITSYEDLVDPKWAGRICTRSGTHAYNTALTAAMIAHHGEDYTKEWLTGLKANLAMKPQGNDRAQVKSIWAGECDISLGNTYYMGEMLEDDEQRQWAEAVRIEFPAFEDGGTHVNISGVAMTAHAKHPEDALKFMEFLTSPEAQAIYAAANHEYPVSPTAAPSDLVASWGSFTPDNTDLMDLAGLRGTALKLVQEVDFDG
ncbi:Fe(3+) ABC transporter substrate-binding protein [Sinisalibacter aestuarii]|uniref:Iron ABC transporter substrate-binding protein n=1 Tax=Sinisalibacter aestuarii TaxID=2949426 RepID=A0ABQ5LTK8_9RHOB|nr:Fe(3+) ABC transporter substrate-binding protein [Sinisalibacter aestuarii]GKY87948.1 iron ABC transporter substrate-binding protein [Sinisalibacter aestuarii]